MKIFTKSLTVRMTEEMYEFITGRAKRFNEHPSAIVRNTLVTIMCEENAKTIPRPRKR